MFRKVGLGILLLALAFGIFWVPRLPSAWTLWAVGLCLDATQPAPPKRSGNDIYLLDRGGAIQGDDFRVGYFSDENLRGYLRESGRKGVARIELQVPPELPLGDVIRGVMRLRQAAADVGRPLHIDVEWLVI